VQRTVWAVVLAIAAVATPIGQTTADGEITGGIMDASGAGLPGVRVVISRGDERREAITDNDGRFVLGMLELGTYRVAAELGGFVPTSGIISSPRARADAPPT
jgi:hypothetical protein